MNALIEIKTVYGQKAYVPLCETAKTFAEIAGTKTLTRQTIDAMKRLGYTINVAQTLPTTI